MTQATPFTLPVWVAAAARAGLEALLEDEGLLPGAVASRGSSEAQPLELLEPPGVELVPVEAAATLGHGQALGMARCDPGDGLDLTRGLLVWVRVSWWDPPQGAEPSQRLLLEAGEGLGVMAGSRELCLSAYARRLLEVNLLPLVPAGRGVRLQLVFPRGRELAGRTSNEAFGVVDGLALIGTQAVVQRSAAPERLEQCLEILRQWPDSAHPCDLVLVIGENGLDLAPRLGLPAGLLLKAGNWLGPLIVAAAEAGVERLLLFGYHGKLIKLAGGIFHTHHHLADGRAEVLTALAALEGLAGPELKRLFAASTVEAALADLQQLDGPLAARVEARLALAIETRSQAYLARYGRFGMRIGAALFDRQRQLRVLGPCGQELLEAFRHDLG
ncbi:cobalt-precorrin-5B (C(1))-methyltransferase CbiD [Synechococcus sp. BA-124 BA4]|uniref:cobalt-precorrin-5B (C(1))-methyltransferase CbiD n=1 Tax=unclassified Synechococcus TaxID=2626047 RepID=UPI0018CF61C5|nr:MULTISPECIES: cobalt-precorrin-5B (C(1))-methyltransferase CbiD [unclassified Synechococcus]MEA5400478.1 cobalt-precorrin-5B (C(1))-methyltransferase CbiD [Synechococcus sp. BA-124 BA4]QPN57961.1 cobalt-precorrin-5B (C(1))-methyltransferase [Synechococcus sp. CBW1107]CAK6688059.1 Cobalt-precorrin-5B C(1)-methyltransferase [Synechococcus sp. CBW1107]